MNNVTLPLAIANNHLVAGEYEFEFNVVNLGVPGSSGIYVLGDMSPLADEIGLWFRYVHRFASSECDVTKSIMLGKISNLRIVGGAIVGTAHIYEHMRGHFDEIVHEMGGAFNSGIAAEIQCTLLDAKVKVNKITRIIGSMFLMEDGRSLTDTDAGLTTLIESLKHRTSKPFTPTALTGVKL